jgi:hypothetical protein
MNQFKMKISYAFVSCLFIVTSLRGAQQQDSVVYPYAKMPDVYPGSTKLTLEGDLSQKMLDGAHVFIDRKIGESLTKRASLWKRDLSSSAAYERSIEDNRKHFMKYIGVVDKLSFSLHGEVCYRQRSASGWRNFQIPHIPGAMAGVYTGVRRGFASRAEKPTGGNNHRSTRFGSEA